MGPVRRPILEVRGLRAEGAAGRGHMRAWGWVAAVVTAAVGLAVGIRTMVRTTD